VDFDNKAFKKNSILIFIVKKCKTCLFETNIKHTSKKCFSFLFENWTI
jgi:hypothetical protein